MIRFFLCSLLSLTFSFASDFYKGDSLVLKGVYSFYNYDFDEAVDILTNAREEFPDHPGVHLIWAASRWVRAQSTLSIEETYTILDNDLKEINLVYDDLIEKYYYDPTYLLYQGSAIGLKARVTLGRKQWLKTLYHAYKGFIIIEDVADKHPDVIDAQLPIGIIEYYAGLSNSMLKWAVKIYGLNASKESGLQKMNLAADQSEWAWIEAKSILSNLYLWVEDEPILAYAHSKDLAQKFPNNFYFNLLYLESSIRTSNESVSISIIKDMDILLSELSDRQREWYSPYLTYEKGLYAFYQKDYKTALKLVEITIEKYAAELDIILANAFLLQGMCYEMLDNRGKAKASYNKCIDIGNFSNAIEKSKLYLKQPFAGLE